LAVCRAGVITKLQTSVGFPASGEEESLCQSKSYAIKDTTTDNTGKSIDELTMKSVAASNGEIEKHDHATYRFSGDDETEQSKRREMRIDLGALENCKGSISVCLPAMAD
jgi:hypothetical protein